MRIRDWSSDVCSSDLAGPLEPRDGGVHEVGGGDHRWAPGAWRRGEEEKGTPRKKRAGKSGDAKKGRPGRRRRSVDFLDRGHLAAPAQPGHAAHVGDGRPRAAEAVVFRTAARAVRVEQHTSELS